MLHLLGYDHELGEQEDIDMRRRQREIVARLGLAIQTDERTEITE
jgi:ssRNA-specific RNase YbeY (16S rRNA maturation enzyme)